MEIKTVKLADIKGDENRKHTKDEGFEQLVSSIQQLGVIEPPALRELVDGGYKVMAGRRRIAALRKLKAAETECKVYDATDPVSDDEIALAENVNRLEMHPLDETALFASMADKGMSAEEIAKYYARSPSAIYKRLRLRTLIDEAKGMFRDGRLNINGAALLAELPEEDQKEFYNLRGVKTDDGDHEYDEHVIRAVESHIVSNFIYKKQKNMIEESMKEICAGCKKRTHNEDNALFPEESEYFCDVCLDGECYRAKWYTMISDALEAQMIQMSEAGLKTDDKIFFIGGAPERIYKNADKVNFNIFDENVSVIFTVMRDKNYERTGQTNRKKDACWEVRTDSSGKIDVRRVGYKEREKPAGKVSGAGKKEAKTINEKIKSYGSSALETIAQDMQMPTAEVVKKLDDKYKNEWKFKREISEHVFERVVAIRIEKDGFNGENRSREYLEILLSQMIDVLGYGDRSLDESEFDEFQKKWLRGLFGNMFTIKKIASLLCEEAHQLFHFLFLSMFDADDDSVPDPDDLKKIGKEKNIDDYQWYLFWKYAGMSVEEYTALYLQAAKDVAAAALKPAEKKPKAKLKKKAGAKEEDNYPFSPDPQDPEDGD